MTTKKTTKTTKTKKRAPTKKLSTKKARAGEHAPRRSARHELVVIGWREWVALPNLGVASLKAKVDTGARTSSLHGFDIEEFTGRGGVPMVSFGIHPEQRSSKGAVRVEAPLVDRRNVRPSSGHAELRPVIATEIELMGQRWMVELTITSRDQMGFRMLLGRRAMRKRFLVDPHASFLNGRRVKGTKRLKRRKGKKS